MFRITQLFVAILVLTLMIGLSSFNAPTKQTGKNNVYADRSGMPPSCSESFSKRCIKIGNVYLCQYFRQLLCASEVIPRHARHARQIARHARQK